MEFLLFSENYKFCNIFFFWKLSYGATSQVIALSKTNQTIRSYRAFLQNLHSSSLHFWIFLILAVLSFHIFIFGLSLVLLFLLTFDSLFEILLNQLFINDFHCVSTKPSNRRFQKRFRVSLSLGAYKYFRQLHKIVKI